MPVPVEVFRAGDARNATRPGCERDVDPFDQFPERRIEPVSRMRQLDRHLAHGAARVGNRQGDRPFSTGSDAAA
jgi:hypothetical protein